MLKYNIYYLQSLPQFSQSKVILKMKACLQNGNIKEMHHLLTYYYLHKDYCPQQLNHIIVELLLKGCQMSLTHEQTRYYFSFFTQVIEKELKNLKGSSKEQMRKKLNIVVFYFHKLTAQVNFQNKQVREKRLKVPEEKALKNIDQLISNMKSCFLSLLIPHYRKNSKIEQVDVKISKYDKEFLEMSQNILEGNKQEVYLQLFVKSEMHFFRAKGNTYKEWIQYLQKKYTNLMGVDEHVMRWIIYYNYLLDVGLFNTYHQKTKIVQNQISKVFTFIEQKIMPMVSEDLDIFHCLIRWNILELIQSLWFVEIESEENLMKRKQKIVNFLVEVCNQNLQEEELSERRKLKYSIFQYKLKVTQQKSEEVSLNKMKIVYFQEYKPVLIGYKIQGMVLSYLTNNYTIETKEDIRQQQVIKVIEYIIKQIGINHHRFIDCAIKQLVPVFIECSRKPQNVCQLGKVVQIMSILIKSISQYPMSVCLQCKQINNYQICSCNGLCKAYRCQEGKKFLISENIYKVHNHLSQIFLDLSYPPQHKSVQSIIRFFINLQ